MSRFEKAKALAMARSYNQCEGCGISGHLDPHHRMTRGAGGVHRAAAYASNTPHNLLMLCRPCHDRTLSAATIAECIGLGWMIERRSGAHPADVAALIHTVNGKGWWFLTADGGYRWADDLNIQPGYRHTYKIENEET